jgi:hypothetical protein
MTVLNKVHRLSHIGFATQLLVALNRLCRKKAIPFFLRRQNSLRQTAPIVCRHAVFPLEKIGDVLRLDSRFDAADASSLRSTRLLFRDAFLQLFPPGSSQIPACTRIDHWIG